MVKRCRWVEGEDQLYVQYHDTEWGVPITDDRTLFEFIVLESAQAGLSWKTILHKRKGYRNAFYNFDFTKVGGMTKEDIEHRMCDSSIVRNRAKIEATVRNARAFSLIVNEFGSFHAYLGEQVRTRLTQSSTKRVSEDIPETTEEAIGIARDLKKRGFSFLGPKVCYAFMQAVGMVNDHTQNCFRHLEIEKVRKKAGYN